MPENLNINNNSSDKIRLAGFITKNIKAIAEEWENFARTLTPAASNLTRLSLRDHIPQILNFIINDINTPQTSSEQIEKSHGNKEKESTLTVAETHAALRLTDGFDIDQMVSEWRALRASIIKLWSNANNEMHSQDIIDLIRFNEAIDQQVAESVSHYTRKVNYSKDLFIGILSHELRNPLNVISMASHLQLKTPVVANSNERYKLLATQISESAVRATGIINDLLDITRARFGGGLPVTKAPMDMGFVCKLLVKEAQTAHPSRKILLTISGDLDGQWDQLRIGQVLANLISNAIQYSFSGTAITVDIKGESKKVIFSVHNEGKPIEPERIGTIFDSLTRAITDEANNATGVNLGLGLYIAKEIVVAHKGTIEVISSKDEGTKFTVILPRA